jgi:isoleucyl-tRNA synthetase
VAKLEEVDRSILARYAELGVRVLDAYDAYDYGPISQAVTQFATVDLSAFYNDISKDRLYTFAARSAERRSAQTAMYLMADGLTRLLAPILSFTSDELWRFMPGGRDESVHMALFPARDELEAMRDPALVQRWERLAAVREQVLAEIEPLRKNKQIGSSLQAKVVISATRAELPLLEQYAKQLPMLFIVSEVKLRPAPDDVEAHAEAKPRVTIERAGGVKCERCWRYVPAVSTDPDLAGLCDRCQDAIAETIHG